MTQNKSDWRYTITHKNTDTFEIGDVVFVKGSSHIPLLVTQVEDSHILEIKTLNGIGVVVRFPVASILQYQYAGLKSSSNGMFNICLN